MAEFKKCFHAIDKHKTGRITIADLRDYMKRMNYTEKFVTNWLKLFHTDENGVITYENYCKTFGLIPRKHESEEVEPTPQMRAEMRRKQSLFPQSEMSTSIPVSSKMDTKSATIEELQTETNPEHIQEFPVEPVSQSSSDDELLIIGDLFSGSTSLRVRSPETANTGPDNVALVSETDHDVHSGIDEFQVESRDAVQLFEIPEVDEINFTHIQPSAIYPGEVTPIDMESMASMHIDASHIQNSLDTQPGYFEFLVTDSIPIDKWFGGSIPISSVQLEPSGESLYSNVYDEPIRTREDQQFTEVISKLEEPVGNSHDWMEHRHTAEDNGSPNVIVSLATKLPSPKQKNKQRKKKSNEDTDAAITPESQSLCTTTMNEGQSSAPGSPVETSELEYSVIDEYPMCRSDSPIENSSIQPLHDPHTIQSTTPPAQNGTGKSEVLKPENITDLDTSVSHLMLPHEVDASREQLMDGVDQSKLREQGAFPIQPTTVLVEQTGEPTREKFRIPEGFEQAHEPKNPEHEITPPSIAQPTMVPIIDSNETKPSMHKRKHVGNAESDVDKVDSKSTSKPPTQLGESKKSKTSFPSQKSPCLPPVHTKVSKHSIHGRMGKKKMNKHQLDSEKVKPANDLKLAEEKYNMTVVDQPKRIESTVTVNDVQLERKPGTSLQKRIKKIKAPRVLIGKKKHRHVRKSDEKKTGTDSKTRFPRAFTTQPDPEKWQCKDRSRERQTRRSQEKPFKSEKIEKKKKKSTGKSARPLEQWKIRPSLRKRGVVVILLAGRHRGKRVVSLGRHKSTGLLLVTGPFRYNGCPMRRVHPNMVIATRTIIGLSKFKLPPRVHEKGYFARQKTFHHKRSSTNVDDLLEPKSEKSYKPSEERRSDQVTIDNAVCDAIRQHPESSTLIKYLKSLFCLGKHDQPHKMLF